MVELVPLFSTHILDMLELFSSYPSEDSQIVPAGLQSVSQTSSTKPTTFSTVLCPGDIMNKYKELRSDKIKE